jgi:hypothetical protein
MMRFNVLRHFILTCCALSLSGLLFVACGASPNLEKTAPSFDEEFFLRKSTVKNLPCHLDKPL